MAGGRTDPRPVSRGSRVIGGKVADPSALAAYARGDSIALQAWLATASDQGIALAVPSLALAEVRAVHPDAAEVLSRLLDHPWVVDIYLTRGDAVQVDRLLRESQFWDGTAGHVILVARQRGWPVLTTDPGRLQRIAPDLDVDLL